MNEWGWLIQLTWTFVVLGFWDSWRRRQYEKKLQQQVKAVQDSYFRESLVGADVKKAKADFERNYDYASAGTEGAEEVLILDKNYDDGEGPNLKIHVWGKPKFLTRPHAAQGVEITNDGKSFTVKQGEV